MAAFMLILFCISSAQAQSINQTFEHALQAFHQEKYQASIIHLKNILSQDESHLPSRVLMAENLLELGSASAAEIELNTAIRAGADKYKTTPLLAKAYLQQSNFQKILDIYIPETSSNNYQSIMQTYIGYAYLGQRHYLSAKQAYNEALIKNPTNINAFIGLAKVAILQENFEQALPLLQQALTIDNEHPQALLMLSIIYKLQNNTEAALAKVNQLILLDDENYSALLTRAMLLSSLDRPAEAITDLDNILKHYPNEPIANYIRLLASQSEQEQESAKKLELHLITVLASIPTEAKTEQPVFLFLTGLVNFQNNAMENAQKALLKYHKIAPEDTQALALLARTEMALGDYYSAKKYLIKAHLLDELNPDLWMLLARNYMMTSELEKAEFYFNKVLQNRPTNLTAIIDLATLELLKENYPAMQTLLEPATEISTDNVDQKSQILVLLLKALQKLQKFDLAMVYSKQLLLHDPENSYAHQIQGTLYALSGNIHQAKKYYIRAIELDEQNFQAVMFLARVEALLGNVTSSLSLLKTALKAGPNSALYIELGDVYFGIGDQTTSLTWYQKALAHNPSSFLALNKIVTIMLTNNQLDEATSITEDYIETFDESAEGYKLLAQLYLQQGKYQQSLSQMKHFVKFAPDRADAFYQLAQLQISTNLTDEAILSLQKSIAWQNSFEPSYLLLISLYTSNKDQANALKLIDDFSALAKDVSLTARLKADIYWSTGQKNNALRLYLQSYQATKNREALLGLYRVYRSNQQYPLIATLLNSWLIEYPDDLTIAISYAENYRHMGDLKAAGNYYDELVTKHPDNAVILNNAAIIYRELGAYDTAAKLSDDAYLLLPQNVSVIDTKAWIEFHRGNYTEALALLRKASTLEYENAEIKYHLAATLAMLDRKKEARKYLKAAVLSQQQFPEKSQARALLATW